MEVVQIHLYRVLGFYDLPLTSVLTIYRMDGCLHTIAVMNQVHHILISYSANIVATYPLCLGLEYFVWGRIQSPLKIIILVVMSALSVSAETAKLDFISSSYF